MVNRLRSLLSSGQSDLMLRAVRAPRADSWSPHEDRFGFLVEFYPILM